MSADPPVHTGDDGAPERGPDGRYLAGHTGSGGRPKDDKLRELRQAVRGCVTADQLKGLIGKMLEDAMGEGEGPAPITTKSGETLIPPDLRDRVAAARLVLEYTVGTPKAMDAFAVEIHQGDKQPLIVVRSMERLEADDES